MEPNKKLTPHFFFLSIGVLVTLIASVSAFLNLAFATLDHVFPDVLNATYQTGYVSYSFEGMRSALAVLIIVFPVFLILSRLWIRAQKQERSLWDQVLRKWVLYLILFLASITVVVDLVTLVRYFVSGEITVRFLLKVALVLVVAGLAGWHYVRALKGQYDWTVKWVALKSGVLTLALIVWSFSVMGSPMSQRDLRLDQRRIEDLQSIQWQVITFWQQKQKLPQSLDELSNPLSGFVVPKDPEFQKGRAYEYMSKSSKTFELCATFSLPIPEGWVENGGGGVMPMRDVAVSSMLYGGVGGDSWKHDVGRTCFERTIDPDMYPPFQKQ